MVNFRSKSHPNEPSSEPNIHGRPFRLKLVHPFPRQLKHITLQDSQDNIPMVDKIKNNCC